jgi:hypothetical protein
MAKVEICNMVSLDPLLINGENIKNGISVIATDINKHLIENLPEFISGIIGSSSFVSIYQEAMASQYSEEARNDSNCKSEIFAKDIVHWFPVVVLFIIAILQFYRE